MKKLFVLQVGFSLIAYLILGWFGLSLSQVALFAWVPIFLTGYVWLWWFRNVFFFRDPERLPPQGDNLLLSPADGRVMYLYQVSSGEVISDKQGRRIPITELSKTPIENQQGWLVGIYMTPFDVHFSRAPIAGEISTLHYYRTGSNLPMVDLWEYINFALLRKAVDMFAAPFHLENERMTMQIKNDRFCCFVILIADRFVNKITAYFEDAQQVRIGEKLAFIQRGSQTDLFVPHENLSFEVRPGQQVYAGRTVLATFD